MDNLIKQFKIARGLLAGFHAKLIVNFILELIAIALSLLFVYYTKQAMDLAVSDGTASLTNLLAAVAGCLVVSVLLKSFVDFRNEHYRQLVLIRLQNQAFDAQMLSSWAAIKSWHTGDVQLRIQTDCEEIATLLVSSVPAFFLTLVRLLASFVFLWSMDPMLSLIILAIMPLLLFSKIYFRKMRKLNEQIKNGQSEFGKTLQENLRFRILIRGMNLFDFRRSALMEDQDNVYQLKMKQLYLSTFTNIGMKICINSGYLVTLIWGILRISKGEITFGTLTAFLQLIGRIQGPVLSIVALIPLFIRSRVSMERVLAILHSDQEKIGDTVRISNIEEINIKDLSFKYAEEHVFQNLNLHLEKGKPVAIIGTSGKGKTTLLRLLLKLINHQKGEVTLRSGTKEIDLQESHRVNFSYVPQGNTLFNGTIRQNILSKNLDASTERLEEAIKLACAEFIYNLPDGLETLVGESGFGLSEGQAQRIAIARAILDDAPVYLFDEITSALDSATTEKLSEHLIAFCSNKICLFVTHDPGFASKLAKVVDMSNY